MSPNKRILLNILATYGRSLYAMALGLFTARWALSALGQSDYGLLGVVGGLAMFITYLNSILSGAMSRFFAIAVGEQREDRDIGIENARKWFTAAVIIQAVVPTALMIICYPVGEWAVRHFLTIPPDRVAACVWVWRFVCVSCYISMVTMPYNAMYLAHQHIAELTIYSFATTTLNAIFLFYMVTHPSPWLTKYAFCQCLMIVLPNILIASRAVFIFQECRIVRKNFNCWSHIKEIASFSLWNSWGCFGAVLRSQGLAILVNKYFGSKANAGVSVGTSLSAHCDMLSGSMQGAFSPAIYNAWGAKDYNMARSLAFRVCKFGTLLVMIFSIPLALEIDEVLRLCLVNPPPYAGGICLFVMAMGLIDKLSTGHFICVTANGQIAKYQAFLGTSLVLTLPIAWLLVVHGVGVYSIGWAMVATMAFCSAGRVWFARHLVDMSVGYWARRVLLPLSLAIASSLAIGALPGVCMRMSFLRVCVTTGVVEMFLLPFAWFVVLDADERRFVASRIGQAVSRLKAGK